MNTLGQLKRFCLQFLLSASGVPVIEGTLHAACRTAFPALLKSDFTLAINELTESAYIIATRDELDNTISYALTTKGELRAKQL